MKNRTLLLFIILSFPFFIFSQKGSDNKENLTNRDNYIISIKKAQGAMITDGLLDEQGWADADVAKDFWRVLPIDTGYADTQTEVRLTYDEKTLYMALTCFESMPGDNIVESLRRDFSFGANDNFLVFIDTYNDQTNGFSFGISAGGAQCDGLQADGGFVAWEWDCKWESALKHFKDYWTVEMAIPFKNLKFQAGSTEWGINFSRLDLKRNEKSSWAPVPRQFQTASLAFTGTLKWDAPPPRPKTNLSLIPYVLGSVSKDIENEEKSEFSGDAGIDAKISLTPTLNLDLTFNPDFSQVDVDEQVTDLDRFELFFPEKRRFFLENEDLFTGFGRDGIRPFFSRRIGLQSPVRAGVRLSGRVGDKWRVGLLNMQTGKEDEIPAANFTVASLQKQVFSRSNIGMFFVNKQPTLSESDKEQGIERFNRVIGVDYNLASQDNRWRGKAFFHKSLTPGEDDKGHTLSTNLVYATQQLELEWNYDFIGEDYLAEAGFVNRLGFHRFSPSVGFKFYPKSKTIANHGPELQTELLYDPQFNSTDRGIRAAYGISFLDRSDVEMSIENEYVKLLNDFDLTNLGRDSLKAGTDYNWSLVELEYRSAPSKLLLYQFEAGYGGFFNGKRFNLISSIKYRLQPFGSISLNLSYDNLQFPEPFQDVDFFLIGPKFDFTFTNNIFLTAFFQYNEQNDNINTNIRFQWRYAPVSDLFIVYSDNYYPTELNVKNRGLVVKMSYWFN